VFETQLSTVATRAAFE